MSTNKPNTPSPIRVVRCPTCRKSVRYELSNPFRPFCSPLCKNQDIIGWAEESFRIPGKTMAEDEPESPRHTSKNSRDDDDDL